MNGLWMATAAVVAFILTALAGKWGIPLLRKLERKQPAYESGTDSARKQPTLPTLGGILFIIGIVCAILIVLPAFYRSMEYTPVEGIPGLSGESRLQKTRIYGGMIMAVAFAAVGFLDDTVKVARGQTFGLRAGQKLLLQALITGMYLLSLYQAGENGVTELPWIGTVSLGVWYWPLALVGIVATIRACALTDGTDGLTASVVLWCAVAFLGIAVVLQSFGCGIFAAAVVGGCAGFLLYNFPPACILMGDTGSAFLGGVVAALGFALGMPILILPIGIVFVLVAGVNLLQTGYCKLTHGRRLFKKVPLHRHLEQCGWSKEKIILVFNAITIAGGALALTGILFG